MLYLEDYMEMLEQLPQELRDGLTDMREMDLAVQNTTDQLEQRVQNLFIECKNGGGQALDSDVKFDMIKKDYGVALEISDEKVQLADQMHDLVKKYITKLDSELLKLKCDLEADNTGITEKLEKRSLELDKPPKKQDQSQKENRYRKVYARDNMSQGLKADVNPSVKRTAMASQNHNRTVPLKDFEDYHQFNLKYEELVKHNAPKSQQPLKVKQYVQKQRKKSVNMTINEATLSSTARFYETLEALDCSSAAGPFPEIPSTSENAQLSESEFCDVESEDWTFDPDEPRYCLCNQVSYGDMVACDNNACPYEWFHYPCVGIETSPEGDWYCPRCINVGQANKN